MTENSSRLMRIAGIAGAGSAAAGVAIAAALASGVIHDASSAHTTTSSSLGTTQDDQGGFTSTGSGNSTGGIGVPSQQQGPVARSNGS